MPLALTPNWRKKYNVEVLHDGTRWRAMLTCYCGDVVEHKAIEGTNLLDVLQNVAFALNQHESHKM